MKKTEKYVSMDEYKKTHGGYGKNKFSYDSMDNYGKKINSGGVHKTVDPRSVSGCMKDRGNSRRK